MRKLFYCIIIVGCFFSCESHLTAEQIVANALENAHGGKAAWEKIRKVVYEKKTILYDSLGNQEQIVVQTFHNTLKPEFQSIITWRENGIDKKIVHRGETTNVFENGELQLDSTIIQKARNDVQGAQYVFWQPYKLLTDEVELTSEGEIRLIDGSRAYSVKAEYPNSDVVWWYRFDADSWLFIENIVKHGETVSHIQNLQQEENTGLHLHKERKSYVTNISSRTTYLRAHYFYTILATE